MRHGPRPKPLRSCGRSIAPKSCWVPPRKTKKKNHVLGCPRKPWSSGSWCDSERPPLMGLRSMKRRPKRQMNLPKWRLGRTKNLWKPPSSVAISVGFVLGFSMFHLAFVVTSLYLKDVQKLRRHGNQAEIIFSQQAPRIQPWVLG